MLWGGSVKAVKNVISQVPQNCIKGQCLIIMFNAKVCQY